MVRFALFLGAGLILALIFSDASPDAQVVHTDLEFSRDAAIPATSTSIVATSTTLSTKEISTETPTAEKSEEKEFVSSTTQMKSEVTDVLVLPPPSVPLLSSPLNQEAESILTPTLQPEILNEKVRVALVNILCEASSPLRSTSGSGVFVDSRGIILTNAHIAQYFLLEGASIPVSCSIRSGSPARAMWNARLVFIPEMWINKHAKDIVSSRATGTGEHDYALLAITESVEGIPLPSSFPSISMNFEDAAIVTGDPVLIAGYPAEFVGGRAARSALHASTVFSNIKQLLTFSEGIVDVISVGGTVLAQSGSSGGGFIDLYGTLVGLIVTTSTGDTTGSRDLHAITPAHIDRSMRTHIGVSAKDFITQDKNKLLADFAPTSESLSKTLRDAISSRTD